MFLNPLLGLLSPSTAARRDPVPPPPAPRVIVGGSAAPELFMLPKDATVDDLPTLHATGEKRIVQLKADGIHAGYVGGRIVTREGASLDCALHCQAGLRRLEESFGHEMVFDAEYVEEAGFNATLAAQKRGEGDGVLWIYDALPYGAWVTGRCDRPLRERLAVLRERIEASDSPFIGMLDCWELDAADTRAKYAEIVALGYEGVVSKRADSPYVRNRSADWRRIKRVITVDLPIMDSAFNAAGKMTMLMVRAPEGPIRLGRGWSDDEAATLRRANGGAGMLAEVSYQLTVGAQRSIRGAVFHRLRTDKGATA